jgi:hypothetical protein
MVAKSMDVYLMGIIYCPKDRSDQDSDCCLRCKSFKSIEVDRGGDKLGGMQRLYIQCDYAGKSKGIYQASKSGRQITCIDGEPLPVTPMDGEEWLKVSV